MPDQIQLLFRFRGDADFPVSAAEFFRQELGVAPRPLSRLLGREGDGNDVFPVKARFVIGFAQGKQRQGRIKPAADAQDGFFRAHVIESFQDGSALDFGDSFQILPVFRNKRKFFGQLLKDIFRAFLQLKTDALESRVADEFLGLFEIAVAAPEEVQLPDVDVCVDAIVFKIDVVGFADDFPVLGNQEMGTENDFARRFARVIGNIDIGGVEFHRRAPGEQMPLFVLSDVGGRGAGIEDDQSPVRI